VQVTLADKTNLLLVRLASRPVPDYFNESIFVDADPEELYAYLYALGLSWAFLGPVLGLFGVAIAYVVHALLGGRHGNVVGAAVILSLCVFAIVGAIDAGWRFWLASAARRRYREVGDQLDARAKQLLARARFTYPTLVLQVVVGLLSAAILLLAAW
jgi:MFS superfamily sulfate permease-like transporter